MIKYQDLPAIGVVAKHAVLQCRNVSDRFALRQYIVMAAFAGSRHLIVVDLSIGNPGVRAMTRLAKIGGGRMRRRLPCRGHVIVASNATLVTHHTVIH
jgi:hypothetical protein